MTIPAAQAVLDAVAPYPCHPPALAAVIRAAADHCIAVPGHHATTEWLAGFQAARRTTHEQLHQLADALEGCDAYS
jgi:hypothetical protein